MNGWQEPKDTVTVTFDSVRKNIEDMTSLSEEEVQEIQNKIDEIEEIVISKENKRKKWSKAKEIIKWISRTISAIPRNTKIIS